MEINGESIIGEIPWAAIDFESAGSAPGETDCPVQVGIAGWCHGDENIELWTSYIATKHPVCWAAAKLHGIRTEMLADAPSFESLWQTFQHHLDGHLIIGHNISTEQRFLRQFPGHSWKQWVDTLPLARHCVPGLPSYALEDVAMALGVMPELMKLLPKKTWHDALFDATACLLILRVLCGALDLYDKPLAMLQLGK